MCDSKWSLSLNFSPKGAKHFLKEKKLVSLEKAGELPTGWLQF